MPKIASPLILALGAVACAPGGVPAPDFVTPFDSVAPDSIRTYLAKLKFDERDGTGDVQYLTVGCPAACRPGPEVAIQPEKRIHQNREASLATGPGRIIARLINRDRSVAYPPLNLGAGDTVYWAVDQVKPADRDVSTGRSLYISAAGLRGERKTVALPIILHVRTHPDQEPYKQPAARWVPVDTTYEGDETPGGGVGVAARLRTYMTWGNCRGQSCCGP